MNVLFFIQYQVMGGVVRQVSLLSDGLGSRGHDVALVGLSAEDGWSVAWSSSVPVLAPLQPRPPKGVLSLGALAAATVRLRRVVREREVDVVYAYSGKVARFMSWLATRRLRGTVVVWGSQGSSGRGARWQDGWKVRLPFLLARLASRSVPLIVANSEAGYSRRRREGFRAPLIVVRNGVDAETFVRSTEARSRVRSEWKLDDEPLVGLVARLDRRKGLEVFLEAAAHVVGRRPDARFVIVGDGPRSYRRELDALAAELGVSGRLVWAGVRSDMPAVYSALDVLCSSSDAEGAPNVVIEAMACGVPCVVTDVGDSAVLVGDAGTLVPPRDAHRLATALVTLIGDLETLDPSAIRAAAVDRFGVEGMVDATERALLSVQRPR